MERVELDYFIVNGADDQEEQNNKSLKALPAGSISGSAITKSTTAPASSSPDIRRIRVPKNRLSPLRTKWNDLIEPLVKHMKLQVRFNTRNKCIEMRNAPNNKMPNALDKSVEYIKAFLLGFELHDILALLKLDDMFLQSFHVKEVRRMESGKLDRAVGRIAGSEGKTKFAIENSTRTRIVIADKLVHLLGSHQNIVLARDSICSLIMGAPPGKVYNHLRVVTRRMKERA